MIGLLDKPASPRGSYGFISQLRAVQQLPLDIGPQEAGYSSQVHCRIGLMDFHDGPAVVVLDMYQHHRHSATMRPYFFSAVDLMELSSRPVHQDSPLQYSGPDNPRPYPLAIHC